MTHLPGEGTKRNISRQLLTVMFNYNLGFISVSDKRKTHLLAIGTIDFACRSHYVHREAVVNSGGLEINEQSDELLVKTTAGTGMLNGMQALSEHSIENFLSCRKCVKILRRLLTAPPALPLFDKFLPKTVQNQHFRK